MSLLYFALFVCVIIHQGLCEDEESSPNYDIRNQIYSAFRHKRDIKKFIPNLEQRLGGPSKSNANMCNVTTEEMCVRFSNPRRWSLEQSICLEKVITVKCTQEVNCWVDYLNGYHSKCVQETSLSSDMQEYPSGCICELMPINNFK